MSRFEPHNGGGLVPQTARCSPKHETCVTYWALSTSPLQGISKCLAVAVAGFHVYLANINYVVAVRLRQWPRSVHACSRGVVGGAH